MIRAKRRPHAEVLPGIPGDWSTLIAGVDGDAYGFGPGRLGRMIYDGEGLFAMWLPMLRRHRWSAVELFGVHCIAPSARFDAMGLVPLLNGSSVRSVTADGATLASAAGSTMSYLREAQVGAVLIWELGRDAAEEESQRVAS